MRPRAVSMPPPIGDGSSHGDVPIDWIVPTVIFVEAVRSRLGHRPANRVFPPGDVGRSRSFRRLLCTLMHTQSVTVMRSESQAGSAQRARAVGLGRGGLVCGTATASLALTTSALALEVPTGVACLPTRAVAPLCRELVITNNPPYPGSQSPQLPVQSFDRAFTEIVGRIPDLVPLATGLGFL